MCCRSEHEHGLIQVVQLTLGWNYYKYMFQTILFAYLPKRVLQHFFEFHILQYYKALSLCPCTLSCVIHYWISFFSAVTSFVAKGQESVFELWGNSVIIDPAEVTRIVNIVMRLIPGRILILLLGIPSILIYEFFELNTYEVIAMI